MGSATSFNPLKRSPADPALPECVCDRVDQPIMGPQRRIYMDYLLQDGCRPPKACGRQSAWGLERNPMRKARGYVRLSQVLHITCRHIHARFSLLYIISALNYTRIYQFSSPKHSSARDITHSSVFLSNARLYMRGYVLALRANATKKPFQTKQLSMSCRYRQSNGEVTTVEALVPIKGSSVGAKQSLLRYRTTLICAS
jgi:hypothetical protein